MTQDELDEVLKSLEVVSDDYTEEQQVIDLEHLDLCAPDNIRPFDMPYPHRPNNIDDIRNILGGNDIHSLIGGKVINVNPKLIDYIKTKFDTPTISPAILEVDTSIFDEIIKPFEITPGEEPNVEYDYPIDNYAIVEFGDDYTLGEKVEYSLNIQPGDELDNKTIIGTIKQGGKLKDIRSIFSKGKILKNPDDTFYQIYPDTCNRHFVIKDFEYGQGFDFDTSEIEVYQDKFIKNTMLYTLIKDNIVYSALPDIILNREPPILHYLPFHVCIFKHSHNIYDDYIEDFEEDYGDKEKMITDSASVEQIKQTKGNTKKIKQCADTLNNKREQFLSWIISTWREAKNQSMSRYIENDDDCRYLARETSETVSGSLFTGGMDITEGAFGTAHIGETNVSNYYAQLLSRICMIYGDEWSQKYYDLIAGIIANRMKVEQYSLNYLVSEFNQLFNKNISNGIGNPFAEIQAQFGGKVNVEYKDIYKWIKDKQQDSYNYRREMASRQLANIYWFIINYKGKYNESMAMNTGSTTDMLDLVEEERDKLHKFWDEAISAYYGKSINGLIKEFKNYAENINPYAEWPTPIPIQIEGITYKLYTFANPQIQPTPVPEEDEDIDLDDITPPEEPTDFPIPKVPSDGSNDPTIDEITIKDYEYWVRYFSLATVISIPFLADGFDIPPDMIPIPMPGIYICFAAIFIKQLNLVIVLGLAIRGIWIWPIVLFVNCSSTPASYMTPLIAAIEKLRELFTAKIEKIECLVPNLAQVIINKLEEENIYYRKTNISYQVYIDILKNQRVENKELIKKNIKKQYNPNGDTRQVITRLEKLTQLPR